MSFRKQDNTSPGLDLDRITRIETFEDFRRFETITVTTGNWKVRFFHTTTDEGLTLYSISAIGYTDGAYNGTRKSGFDKFQVKLTPSGHTFTSQAASNKEIQKADVLALLNPSETLLVIL